MFMLFVTFFGLLQSSGFAELSNHNTTVVRVGLIYSGKESLVWAEGWTAVPTVQLALEQIHKYQDDLGNSVLPEGVEIEFVEIDSGCWRPNARSFVLDRIKEGDVGRSVLTSVGIQYDLRSTSWFFYHRHLLNYKLYSKRHISSWMCDFTIFSM